MLMTIPDEALVSLVYEQLSQRRSGVLYVFHPRMCAYTS